MKRIAVLGAGIMGSCLALALARQGHSVTLFDQELGAMGRASRWNEGKIHLGHMYAADPSLETTRKILPGGLAFADALSSLVGADVRPAATKSDDTYLIHRDSVVTPDEAAAHYAKTDDLICAHPSAGGYLRDLTSAKSRRLGSGELASITDHPDIVAGFSIPERSVDTNRIAELVIAALAGQTGVDTRFGTRVTGAQPKDAYGGPWHVATDAAESEVFDIVINALWEGRLAIDQRAGLTPMGQWSHRYRLALFVRTDRPVSAPSAIVTVGPFGDIKNYGDNSYYLSWYPAGLVMTDHGTIPPDPGGAIAERLPVIEDGVRRGLGHCIPAVYEVLDAATETRVEGGWVFAQAAGSLSDPGAAIHRRDRYGVTRRGNYISVDTGKYSTAPKMALDLAEALA